MRGGFRRNSAIVIGIEDYTNGISRLSTAKADAERLAKILKEQYKYEVLELGGLPILDNLRTFFNDTLPKVIQPDDRLLFYFAGHGKAVDSKDGPMGYLVPQDARADIPNMHETFLPMQELHDAFKKLSCRHLLAILDCCFAGAFRWVSTRNLTSKPEKIYKESFERFINNKAWQVITSAAYDQTAFDVLRDNRVTNTTAEHSPFAEALFDALEKMEADYTKDGITTATELYLYLEEMLSERTKDQSKPQSVGLWSLAPDNQGEYIFTGKFDRNNLPNAPRLSENNNPYRGLEPFEEVHSRLFFGREELVKELHTHVTENAPTVVLGASGSGKSSLVKAGLIPHLRQDRTANWQILTPMRPGALPFTALANVALPLTSLVTIRENESLNLVGKAIEQTKTELDRVLRDWRSANTEIEISNCLKHIKTLIATDNLPVERSVQPRSSLVRSKTSPFFSLAGIVRSVVDKNDNAVNRRVYELEDIIEKVQERLAEIYNGWTKATREAQLLLVINHFEDLIMLCQKKERQELDRLRQLTLERINILSQTWQKNPNEFVELIGDWTGRMQKTKLLLTIDQFEELVTQCSSAQRQQFLNLLALVLHDRRLKTRFRLVLTLRSDFEPRFVDTVVKPLWATARFPIRPMQREELRHAIAEPAAKTALYFEPPELVDQLIDEVGQTPGALPLLSFTLSELYIKLHQQWVNEGKLDRALKLDEEYKQQGGIGASLTRRATKEYDELSPALQLTMRRVMLRMVAIESGESTRRRVPLSELVYPNSDENKRVNQVLERLTNARMIVLGVERLQQTDPAHPETIGEAYAEPTHDFLIKGWEKLQRWRVEAQGDLILQRRLTAAANEWHQAIQSVSDGTGDRQFIGLLWDQNPRLGQAKQLLEPTTDTWLNERETKFVDSSLKRKDEVEADLREQLRREQSLRVQAELREKAARVENLLTVQPTHALAVAIQAIGQNLKELPGTILSPVQTSLHRVMETVRVQNILHGHAGAVTAIAFSPDGEFIASGGIDKTVRLWDKQGKLIFSLLEGHDGSVVAVAFSADGQTILSGSRDGKLLRWNLTGKCQTQFKIGEHVTAVALSQGGQYIAVGDRQGIIHRWTIDGKHQTWQSPTGTVTAIALSADGRIIATGSPDGTLCLWQEEQMLFSRREHQGRITSIAFCDDRRWLVSGSGDGTVRLWTLAGEPVKQPLRGHSGYVFSTAFCADGQTIISGGGDGTVQLWNLDGQRIGQPLYGHDGGVTCVAAYPSIGEGFGEFSLTIVSGSEDGTLRLWDLRDKNIGQPLLGHRGSVRTVAISPDGRVIASGGDDKTIRLWSSTGQAIGQPLRGHERGVTTIAFSGDDRMLVSGSEDKTIRLWSRKGDAIAQPLWAHRNTVTAVAVSPAIPVGQIIISGGADKILYQWDLEDTPIGQLFDVVKGSVNCICFSIDGQMIAAATESGTVYLWSCDGKPIARLEHESGVTAVAISPVCQSAEPSDRLIVTGSRDSMVRLWTVQGTAIGYPLRGHVRGVTSISFSPDGQAIASGSEDGTIRLWDIGGVPIGSPFRGHQDYVTSIAFSPDGQTIVSGSRDGTLRLWRGAWKAWLRVCCDRVHHHPTFRDAPTGSAENEAYEICRILDCYQ